MWVYIERYMKCAFAKYLNETELLEKVKKPSSNELIKIYKISYEKEIEN